LPRALVEEGRVRGRKSRKLFSAATYYLGQRHENAYIVIDGAGSGRGRTRRRRRSGLGIRNLCALKPSSKIDELVYGKLQQSGIPPAHICSDAVFVRRVHLDVIGTLPTADEARRFIDIRRRTNGAF